MCDNVTLSLSLPSTAGHYLITSHSMDASPLPQLANMCLDQLGDEVVQQFEEHSDAWPDLLENVSPFSSKCTNSNAFIKEMDYNLDPETMMDYTPPSTPVPSADLHIASQMEAVDNSWTQRSIILFPIAHKFTTLCLLPSSSDGVVFAPCLEGSASFCDAMGLESVCFPNSMQPMLWHVHW